MLKHNIIFAIIVEVSNGNASGMSQIKDWECNTFNKKKPFLVRTRQYYCAYYSNVQSR